MEAYCRGKDFAGYCKFDALNAPLVEKICGKSRVLRLLATQLVNRIPLPLRKWSGVIPRRNPKGVANFILGYVDAYRITGKSEYLHKVIELSDWLLRNESHEINSYQGVGKAWGYHFPWQSPGFFAPRHAPNCIVTTFVGEALLSAFEITGKRKYLDAAFGVRDFLLKGLPTLLSNDHELCIGYVANGLRWRVININSVAAGFLARLAVRTVDRDLMLKTRRMIQWICNRRNTDFTWDYTSPKEQSGIGPDNYHTGGILDGIFDYMTMTGDEQFSDVYLSGLKAYQRHFFTDEGAPKWRMDRVYPQDIHGAAQGIITFSKAGTIDPKYLEVAARIQDWALKNLWDEKQNRFYYQKYKFFTWKIDLMRWNNSWMFRAMIKYESTISPNKRIDTRQSRQPSLEVSQ